MIHVTPPSLHSLTVAAGTGTLTVAMGGQIVGIGIKPPTAGSTYDIDITDVDGFGLCGAASLTGTITIPFTINPWGDNTITISNASVDGTYKVKIWYD